MIAQALLTLALQGATPSPTPLRIGGLLPEVSAQTLARQPITLAPSAGRTTVVVISFAKDASTAAASWMTSCRALAKTATVDCYEIRMLEGLPRLLRGFVEGRMRGSEPKETQGNVVLLYKGAERWRTNLGVTNKDENTPRVLVARDTREIVAIIDTPFDATALKKAVPGP